MGILKETALRIAHAMVLNTAINDEWFIEFARRLLAEQQKQDPVAFATNGYGTISLYWCEGLDIDFIPNGTTIGLYAAPVAKAQDGMVMVAEEALDAIAHHAKALTKAVDAFQLGLRPPSALSVPAEKIVLEIESMLNAAMLTKEPK